MHPPHCHVHNPIEKKCNRNVPGIQLKKNLIFFPLKSTITILFYFINSLGVCFHAIAHNMQANTQIEVGGQPVEDKLSPSIM